MVGGSAITAATLRSGAQSAYSNGSYWSGGAGAGYSSQTNWNNSANLGIGVSTFYARNLYGSSVHATGSLYVGNTNITKRSATVGSTTIRYLAWG